MTKILIVKMWALGDILMATPMLNAIREREPQAHITWIVDSHHAEILANHPLIDDLIAIDSGAWRRMLRKVQLVKWAYRTNELHLQMKQKSFDIAINCQPEKWWTYFLCPARLRIALYPSPNAPASRLLYTKAITKPKRKQVHNTDNFLEASAAAGFPPASKQMTLGDTFDQSTYVSTWNNLHPLASGEWRIILAPFSTALNRSLEIKTASRIAEWLARQLQAQVVITGGPQNNQAAAAIQAAAGLESVIVATNTTVRQYLALLKTSNLIITVDSSAMHIAGAFNIPYVALFGPTPVSERAPLTGHGRILVKPLDCAPCDQSTCSNKEFQKCMKLITFEDIQNAIEAIIGSARDHEVTIKQPGAV